MAALIQIKNGVEGVTLRLEQQLTTMGRSADNVITIHDDLVSKSHARIVARRLAATAVVFEYELQDCDSTNGTFVNDAAVTDHILRQGDIIRLGVNHFRFVDDEHDDLAATARIHKTWIPGIYITKR